MKNIAVTLIILFVSLNVGSQRNHEELVSLNLQWMYDNYEYALQVLKSSNEKEVIPVINIVGEIWKRRDGAVFIEVSDLIGYALLNHTDKILLWFKANPNDFEAWKEKMPIALFTDWSGEQFEELKILKKNLILVLDEFTLKSNSDELTDMANSLSVILKDSNVRSIQ